MSAGSNYSFEVIAWAIYRKIDIDELPLIVNGCSGGLSRIYSLAGRVISCEDCCHCHDIDYQLGGTRKERAEADKRLRKCAAKAGYLPPGLAGKARRAWRGTRAWVMWAAVRLFGGSHWTREKEPTAHPEHGRAPTETFRAER